MFVLFFSGWQTSVGSLAHVGISAGLPTPLALQTSTLLASTSAPIPPPVPVSSKWSVCDTGEPLSTCVIQLLRSLEFVELHEFLPAPLLRAMGGTGIGGSCSCCHANHPLLSDKHSTKTVGDIFTWLLCFHRFAAAASTFHPGKVSQFMAYANTILQAHLEFEGDGWRAYDRAFWLQVSARPEEDWSVLNLPLYARLFTAQSRRRNSCRYCSGRDHLSVHCPWGVDVALPQGTPGRVIGSDSPICLSWNSGVCRFPASCNFRHVCATCLAPHKARDCPVGASRRRPPDPLPPEPPRRPRPMDSQGLR